MDFSRLDTECRPRTVPVALLVLALLPRIALLPATIDVPGDGPTHATASYQMFLAPTFYTHGTWLPGYNYLMFGFYYLLADPVWIPRIINTIMGALTVPLFWYLVDLSFDSFTATFSAAMLAVLPLHIGVSASSLTEADFVFEFVAGTLLMILATNQDRHRTIYLLSSASLLFLAVMTRYEAWLLVPIFLAYYYLKTRRLREGIGLAMVLAAYPIAWSVANYFYFADAFRGFTTGAGWYHGAKPVSWFLAAGIVGYKSARHLGWIMIASMLLGIAMQSREFLGRRVSPENVFYCSMTFITVVAIYRLAMLRGTALWDRYLLFSFVLMLPFAVLPVARLLQPMKIKWSVPAAILLLGFSLTLHPRLYRSLGRSSNDLYVTLWRPIEIIDVAAWMRNGPYRNHAVILTENGGESWYFADYFPSKALTHCVVAWYSPDSLIDDYCLNLADSHNLGENYLFITSGRDRAVRDRLEKSLGVPIDEDKLVYREGYLSVYDVSDLAKARASKHKPTQSGIARSRETHNL